MTLRDYLFRSLGSFAELLEITISSDPWFDFVVDETLESYGVTLEEEATDLVKLHALGKAKLWEKVVIELSQNYNFSTEGESFQRKQLWDMAEANYKNYSLLAIPYSDSYQVTVSPGW